MFKGEADDPVSRVLARAVPLYQLRVADFHAVIDGMRMDAETVIAAARSLAGVPTEEALRRLDAAAAEFSANATRTFSRQGEW